MYLAEGKMRVGRRSRSSTSPASGRAGSRSTSGQRRSITPRYSAGELSGLLPRRSRKLSGTGRRMGGGEMGF